MCSRWWALTAVLALQLVAARAVAQAATPSPGPSADTVSQLVRDLGRSDDTDPLGSLYTVVGAPRVASRLLVNELRIVPFGEGDADFQHVVWCLRALRAITGLDFVFPTRRPLSERQKRLFGRPAPGAPLPFFSERMSTAEIAVAPRDVQEKVVVAWRRWLAENADTFSPAGESALWRWYF
jgi:hypothetical protein